MSYVLCVWQSMQKLQIKSLKTCRRLWMKLHNVKFLYENMMWCQMCFLLLYLTELKLCCLLSPHFLFLLLDDVHSAFPLEHFPQYLSTLHILKPFVGKYSSRRWDSTESLNALFSFVCFQLKSYFFWSTVHHFRTLYGVPDSPRYILNNSLCSVVYGEISLSLSKA